MKSPQLPTLPDPQRPDLSAAARRWADRLHRLGVAGIVATLIEAGAPLSPLLGQLLYVAQPTLGLFMPRASVGAWAAWLDQPDSVRAFADLLESPPADKPSP